MIAITDFCLKWAALADIYDLAEIDKASYTNYWTAADFKRCLLEREFTCLCVKQRLTGKIAGYVTYRVAQETRAVLLASLAVHPEFRGQGLATKLLFPLKKKLDRSLYPDLNCDHIECAIPETMLPAQLFLRTAGFHACHTVKDLFGTSNGDGYVFCYPKVTEKEKLVFAKAYVD